ncbi:SNF2 family N-terminal domain-containing protein [Gorgonomyces haynaldii]|nr:SNF2 family N-terminal domain-containing protein [Gorgonomyces haynaldii]
MLLVGQSQHKLEWNHLNLLDGVHLHLSGQTPAVSGNVEYSNLVQLQGLGALETDDVFFQTLLQLKPSGSFESDNGIWIKLDLTYEATQTLLFLWSCDFRDAIPILPLEPVYRPQPQELRLSMLPFQLRCLQWMIDCEEKQMTLPHIHGLDPITKSKINHTVPRRGGILASQMGLGKTIMALGLVLERKPIDFDGFPCTLLICPSAILFQWMKEIRKHTGLRVLHYVPSLEEPVFESYDFVVVSIEDARKDFWVSTEERQLRRPKKYKRRESHLLKRPWFRLLMDEAQMVGNHSMAYQVAEKIEAETRWCITGTPASKMDSFMELQQYMDFLRLDYNLLLLKQMYKMHPLQIKAILSQFMYCDTKETVKHEMILPTQNQTQLTLRFENVEQVLYNDLWRDSKKQASDLYHRQLKLHSDVAAFENKDLTLDQKTEKQDIVKRLRDTESRLAQALNHGILRLRQTCCHPQIAEENKKLLGNKPRPVSSVLELMLKECRETIDTLERRIIRTSVEQQRWKEKFGLQEPLQNYHMLLEQCRKLLEPLLQMRKDKKSDDLDHDAIYQKIHEWRELEHRILFWIATCYYNLQQTDAERDLKDLKEKEEAYYRDAADLRKVILKEYMDNVTDATQRANPLFERVQQQLEKLETFDVPRPGLLTQLLADGVHTVYDTLDEQLNLLGDWRFEIINKLSQTLDDTDKEAQGNEYEESALEQEKLLILMDGYGLLIGQMRFSINGRRPPRAVQHEIEMVEAQDYANQIKQTIKKFEKSKLSLEQSASDLQHIKYGFNSTPMENKIAQMMARSVQERIKNLNNFEFRNMNTIHNKRMMYYSRLTSLSDHLLPLEDKDPETQIQALEDEKNQDLQELRGMVGRCRYLEYLQQDKQLKESECIICKQFFDNACSKSWFSRHPTCPICKQHVRKQELVLINLKDEPNQTTSVEQSTQEDRLVQELRKIQIVGSFGTKIDLIVKHMLHLLSQDPNVKCLVFSQWMSVLEIIAQALRENHIGYLMHEGQGFSDVKISSKRGEAAQQFASDPRLTAFMLHAKSQSSGLTLTCAHHVFLVEPVLNKGMELQAIGRVHRIEETVNPSFD